MQRARAGPELGRDLFDGRRRGREIALERRGDPLGQRRRRPRRVPLEHLAEELARAGGQPGLHRLGQRVLGDHQPRRAADVHGHAAHRLPRAERDRGAVAEDDGARPPRAPGQLEARPHDQREQVLHADPDAERGRRRNVELELDIAAVADRARREGIGHVAPVHHGRLQHLGHRPARHQREVDQGVVLIDPGGDRERHRRTELADRALAQLLGPHQAQPGVERRIARARALVEHQPAHPRRADQTAYGKYRLRRPRRHCTDISHHADILIHRILPYLHAQECKNSLTQHFTADLTETCSGSLGPAIGDSSPRH